MVPAFMRRMKKMPTNQSELAVKWEWRFKKMFAKVREFEYTGAIAINAERLAQSRLKT